MIVDAVRRVVLEGSEPDLRALLYVAVVAAGTFAVGRALFRECDRLLPGSRVNGDSEVVTLTGVSKRYFRKPGIRSVAAELLGREAPGAIWALRDVDLAVRRGERLGVVGANGAGKTTLLRLRAESSLRRGGTGASPGASWRSARCRHASTET